MPRKSDNLKSSNGHLPNWHFPQLALPQLALASGWNSPTTGTPEVISNRVINYDLEKEFEYEYFKN